MCLSDWTCIPRVKMNGQISVGDHREIALQLLEELNSENVSSQTAKIIRDSIACHLKKGGANLSECDKCGSYKWERQRKNDRWKHVIHDPYECPSLNTKLMHNVIETGKTHECVKGMCKQTKIFPDMGILRRDKPTLFTAMRSGECFNE